MELDNKSNINEAYFLHELGDSYFLGWGNEQSIEKAIERYKKASKFKYSPSMAILGSCYYFGYGVEFSISKAITKKPATIVAMERNTARLAIGSKFSKPKTCPTEETIQSPVEVTTKKT